ncbi:MAG: YbaB/EbfC family nucleoid-associated protein [Phycisphaerales bacterium]|nr:YbaB/EbfC family nucleoid-associated protein [Phycisphaerales bacterium]
MLDALKTAGALASLMKKKDQLKAAGDRVRQRLSEIRAAGGSGGGAVRATVSGDMRVVSVTLEPAVCMGLTSGRDADREQVQQLIVEAVNNAMDIAKGMAQREIAKEAEAMGLPNMPGMEGLLG